MKKEFCLCIVMTIILLSSTCSKEKDDELFKMPYEGSELRLDGYYISENQIAFLYYDGVVMRTGTPPHSSLIELDELILSEKWGEAVRGTKHYWGIFIINEENIELETWGFDTVGPLKIVIRSGNIINDNTFLITSFYNGYSEETTVKNDTFRFRQLSPKLDSTNMFVQ